MWTSNRLGLISRHAVESTVYRPEMVRHSSFVVCCLLSYPFFVLRYSSSVPARARITHDESRTTGLKTRDEQRRTEHGFGRTVGGPYGAAMFRHSSLVGRCLLSWPRNADRAGPSWDRPCMPLWRVREGSTSELFDSVLKQRWGQFGAMSNCPHKNRATVPYL